MLIPHLNPRREIELFGNITGTRTSYKQTTVQDMDEYLPGGAGKEIGEMYQFSSEFGYNANQEGTLTKWNLVKVSCVVTETIHGRKG
jgi:hypothetical protein